MTTKKPHKKTRLEYNIQVAPVCNVFANYHQTFTEEPTKWMIFSLIILFHWV